MGSITFYAKIFLGGILDFMENNILTTEKSWGKWMGLVVVGGIFYLAGQYLASAPQRTEQEQKAEREITVRGTGEVKATPDVAEISFGVTTGRMPTAEASVAALTEKFSQVAAVLKEMGIAEKDIETTNLSTHPVYNYRNESQTIDGYESSENVTVTIRETDKVGEIVARVTAAGVNQTGNINFKIDDPANLESKAREEAINDARENAEELVAALGVKLGRVKKFEVVDGMNPPQLFRASALEVDGLGSGPPVPAGEEEIVATVQVTYELK